MQCSIERGDQGVRLEIDSEGAGVCQEPPVDIEGWDRPSGYVMFVNMNICYIGNVCNSRNMGKRWLGLDGETGDDERERERGQRANFLLANNMTQAVNNLYWYCYYYWYVEDNNSTSHSYIISPHIHNK